MDESVGCADKERLSRLEVENKALREMLEICTTSRDRILPVDPEKDKKANDQRCSNEDDGTDTECDSSILSSSDKKENEEEKEVEDKKNKRPDSVSKDNVSITSKDMTSNNSKEGTLSAGTAKSVVTSKTNDLRKGKTTPIGKTESSAPVKKTVALSGVKKDLPLLKKSPTTEVKKDLKGKTTQKAVTKK